MRNKLGEFFVGDAIKLTSIAVIDAPDSMVVSIWDSDGAKKIDNIEMTVDDDDDKKFTYPFQTDSNWAAGKADVITTSSKDSLNNIQDDYFILEETSH